MPNANDSPRVPRETTDALNAAIERNAELVSSGRHRPSFLQRLGLQLPVTEKDVKQAYFARVKEVHPDHRGDAGEFMQVQQAFEEAIEFAKRNGKRLPWLGTLMPYYVAQRKVTEAVRKWGGKTQLKSLNWLEDTVGEDFANLADRLIEIDLSGCRIGDAEIEQLTFDPQGIEFLEVLLLANTQITDSGAMQLIHARNLKQLDLRGTAVSPRMQAQLAKLPQMRNVFGNSFWERTWRKLTGR